MSFSDMMSSGRGPGVIGMVMALVVLLGFGVLFMFAFDEGFQGAELSDEAAIVQQGKELENYQATIDKGQKSLDLAPQRVNDAKELTRLGLENQMLSQNIVTLGEKLKAAEAGIVDQRKTFDQYKDEYRMYVRGNAKGEKMPELVTLKGEAFKEVIIREVTAIGMQIAHLEGQKRIPFEDLPETMKDYYQFDPSQKEQAIAYEKKVDDIHKGQVAVADKLAAEAAVKQGLLDAEKAKVTAKNKIVAKEAELLGLQREIRNLQAAMNEDQAKTRSSQGSGNIVIRKTSQFKGRIANKQAEIDNLRFEINKLRGSL